MSLSLSKIMAKFILDWLETKKEREKESIFLIKVKYTKDNFMGTKKMDLEYRFIQMAICFLVIL
jgi:hypothetical protein